jgi:hypothetical protein
MVSFLYACVPDVPGQFVIDCLYDCAVHGRRSRKCLSVGIMVQGRHVDARTVGGDNVAELGANEDTYSTSEPHHAIH